MATSQPRVTETEYVQILRQKLGEFMLTMIDLHQRGVRIMKCTFNQDCINSLIDAIKLEGENKAEGHIGHRFNKGNKNGNEHTEYKNMTTRLNNNTLTEEDYNLLKQFIVLIINSKKFNSPIEERLLNVLLYNNGFPCAFSIKNYTDQINPETYNDNSNDLYKMHMILGDITGMITSNPNHYTVDIPENLQTKLGGKLWNYEVRDKKIQIAPDGDCFFTAVAVWCKIYGITEEHLNSITYNVPFDFSREHFESNLKVPTSTKENPIPKPIELPTFKTDALKIASNMKNKIQNEAFRPEFGEPQEIINSSEYKDYDTNGMTKDNGTHCNKYKGNRTQEEQKEEGNSV